MRILLLTNILSPYRKLFYDKLYSSLKEQLIDFKVLVMAETEPERDWHYSEYKNVYCELLPSKTLSLHNIHLHFNKNLKNRLLEFKPDIVIASGSYIAPSVIKTIFLKKKLNYRLLFWSESHMDEQRRYNSAVLTIREFIRNMIYKSFDGFWYAGAKSLELILKYNKNSVYYLIPNLVDNAFFREAAQIDEREKLKLKEGLNIPVGNYVFVLPARLTYVKGIIPFIDLYSNCKYKNKATVLILGEGEQKDKIQNSILKYQLDIRLLGYKKQEEILLFYSAADCFLMPSLSDSNPLSCIEALWAGLPLLLSENVGNHPETITAGLNGYVFRYSDPEEAIHFIDQLIMSSDEWKAKAKQESQRIAEDIYNPDKAVRHLVHSMLKDYTG